MTLISSFWKIYRRRSLRLIVVLTIRRGMIALSESHLDSDFGCHARRRKEIADPWLRRMLAEKPAKLGEVALANKMPAPSGH